MSRNKWNIKNTYGLTLVELLATISILSIILAVAIVAIGNVLDNSLGKSLRMDAVNVMEAARLYVTENTSKDLRGTSITLDQLVQSGLLESKELLILAEVTIYESGVKSLVATGKNGRIQLEVLSGTTFQQLIEHDGKPENGVVSIP